MTHPPRMKTGPGPLLRPSYFCPTAVIRFIYPSFSGFAFSMFLSSEFQLVGEESTSESNYTCNIPNLANHDSTTKNELSFEVWHIRIMWLYYRTVKLNSQLPSLDPGLEWPAWNCISVFLLGDARSVKCGQIILNNHCSSTWRKIMLILLSGAPFLHSTHSSFLIFQSCRGQPLNQEDGESFFKGQWNPPCSESWNCLNT